MIAAVALLSCARIEKARAVALENAEHERAAPMLKRRFLAELEREHARRAAGDPGETYILRPDMPAKTCRAPRALPPRPLPIEVSQRL